MADLYKDYADTLGCSRGSAKALLLAKGFTFGEKDPADDGVEVFVIRETKLRTERWYTIEIAIAFWLRQREIEHILEVERKFVREVEALEYIRRADVQNF